MDDLISRKALITDLRTAKGLGKIIAETLVRFVEKQPTVDAVEVVRCKHCVSFGIYECTGNGYCRHYKGLVDPKPYNFCSYGERKDNEI